MAKLENNIRPDRKICARIAGWCAAAGGASLVVYFAGGQDSGGMSTFLLIAVIALTLALIFGVAALATVGQARSAQRHLEAFAAGNHLIHWTKYSPAEIRAFVAEERSRTVRKGRRLLSWICIIYCGSVAAVLYGVGWKDGAGLAGVLATVGGIFVGIVAAGAWANRRGYDRLVQSGFEVYLARDAAWYNGVLIPFRTYLSRLVSIDVRRGDPAVLCLEMRSGGPKSIWWEVRIPIPRGCEDEAERAAALIRRSG